MTWRSCWTPSPASATDWRRSSTSTSRALANRTTEATKTLTLLGTIVLPTLVITSIFGMNVPYPGWTRSNWIFGVLLGLSLASTAALAWFLRRRDAAP